MGKFNISEEDFDITKANQKKEELKPVKKQASEPVKKKDEVSVPAKETEGKNIQDEVMLPEVNNDDYVRVRVGQIQKKEAMSVKKMVLIKPSVQARIDYVLKNQYPGVSFNSVVNQLLEGWLEEVDTIDN